MKGDFVVLKASASDVVEGIVASAWDIVGNGSAASALAVFVEERALTSALCHVEQLHFIA